MTVLHPQRGRTSGIVPKYGVVVHDSEGGENSLNLLSYLASPGDRPNGSGGFYGGGYNAVASEDGGYVQVAGGDRSPYHAPPLNSTWWSICIPGRAAQTREQWLDIASRAYIRGVARFIVDMWHLDGESWPLTLRNAAELVAGERGITSHAEVSKAWHKTDHTDPGAAFPWDVLAADIAALVLPPVEEHPIVIDPPTSEEDDMLAQLLRLPNGDVVVRGAGPCRRVSLGGDIEHLVATLGNPRNLSESDPETAWVRGELAAYDAAVQPR